MAKTGVAFAYCIQEIAKIVLIKIYTHTSHLEQYYAQFCDSDLEITSDYRVSVLHRVIPRENYCTLHKNKEISEQAYVLFVKLNHTV